MQVGDYVLPYNPHPAQWVIHTHPARFRFVAAGARFGKDMMTAAEIVTTAIWLAEKRKGEKLIPIVHIWYVAPTFSILRQQWRYLTTFIEQVEQASNLKIVKKLNNSLFVMELENGAIIEGKSADKPLQLKGVGLDYLAITEAALVPSVAWEESLAPRLISPGRLGLVLANSSPRGRNNWFAKMTFMGMEKFNDEYAGFRFPTWANPYVDMEWIKRMKEVMPDYKFRQEIAAEFDVDSNFVFAPYEFLFELTNYKPKGDIFIGIDPGGKYDYAAMVFIDYYDDKYYVYDYIALQDDDISAIIKKFADKIIRSPARTIYLESNFGTLWGKTLKEELNKRNRTIKIIEVRTSPKNRQQMLDRILIRMGQDRLKLKNDDLIKKHFMSVYLDEDSKYKHVKNEHDDLVFATAIALEGFETKGGGKRIAVV